MRFKFLVYINTKGIDFKITMTQNFQTFEPWDNFSLSTVHGVFFFLDSEIIKFTECVILLQNCHVSYFRVFQFSLIIRIEVTKRDLDS